MNQNLILGLVTCLLLPAQTARSAVRQGAWERYAVVVSCQSGLDGDKVLKYAHNDASRVAKLLKTIGRVAEKNVFVLKTNNGPELRMQLKSLGERIAESRKRNRRVFLQYYYSGHGAFSYFHVGGDRIAFSDVRKLISADQADARLFVLDVCYGASFFASKGFDAVPAAPVEIKVEEETQGEVVITSSSFDEKSYEVKPLEGSVFTSHWLMALRGAGDKDQDGRVSLFEAYNYAYHKTVSYSAENLNRSQHPTYDIQLQGGRDLVLTRPGAAVSGIIFRNCPAGSYSIADVTRKLSIGDVYLPGGEAFSLALEPGNYEIRHAGEPGGVMAAKIGLGSQTMSPLDYRNFSAVKPGSGTSKGGSVSVPPSPGAKRKTGWSARVYLAGEYFSDERILRDLNKPTELENYYKSTPSFDGDYYNQGFVLEFYLHTVKQLGFGARATFGTRHYASRAAGEEPSIGELPVGLTIEKQLDFQRIGLGPSLRWRFLQKKKFSLGLEAAPQYVMDNISSHWEISRPLYDEFAVFGNNFEGEGYRLQADLNLDWRLDKARSRRALSCHIKTGFFYQSLEMDVAGGNSGRARSIRSREYGIQNAVGISFGKIR